MAIKKITEDGKSKYEVIVKITDKAGRQVMRRRRWFFSERDAKKCEFDLLTELNAHKNKIVWQNWVHHVVEERYRLEYRFSTYLNYKHILNCYFGEKFKDKFIDELKPSDVHDAVFNSGRDISSYTQRGIIKVVKRVFNVAIEEGVIVRNPAVGIRVRCADANQGVLNRNEVQILLAKAREANHEFFEHWTLALFTGMRSGELYSLRWTDVDFVTGKITVSKAWTRKNGEGATKTAKSRVVPMSGECRRFLEELRAKYPDSEFALPRTWVWEQGLQAQILKSFCRDIGITEVKFHDLRATFITQMLNNGVALSKVMAIVGHGSLKTTQGYLRLSGKDVEGATEALGFEVPAQVSAANVIAFRPASGK